MSTLSQLNYSIFQAINSMAGHNPWLDATMAFSADMLIFFLPILLVLAWGRPLNWRREPLSSSETAELQERRATVLWIIVACLLSFGLNLLIEQFIFEPRPFISHHIHVLIAHSADGSFPSDHSAWAFAVVGMFALQIIAAFIATRGQSDRTNHLRLLAFPALLTIAALVIACLIGFARIFVGVHYPGDILGGAFDGLLAAGIVTPLRRWLSRPTNAVLSLAHLLHLA